MVKRKVKVPNIVRGGIAIPLGNNYYFMRGRKHINGGIDIGSNPRTGIEVEDGEIMKMEHAGAKIFSSVPFLNGKSPAQRVMQGENPNNVFKRQESFKDRNNINNDGTTKFRNGGWRSSNKVRSRIAKMEGSSMKTNRSFDLEDRDFYNAIPKEVRKGLSQEALDNLYSYSYNVGAGNFKKRVVPSLINLSRGKATANDVAKSMWASKDSKLKGLRNRRRIEREGFINAYNKNKFNKNITPETIVAPKDNTTVVKPVVTTQQTPMIDLQQRIADKNNQAKEEYANEYNQYVINKGMELMQPKKRYNSTFALGERINFSTGDDSRKKYGFGDEVLSRTKKLAKNMFGFTSDNAVVEVTDSKGRKRNISLGQYRNERAARANAPARTTKERMSRAIAPKFRESEVSYNPFTNKYSYDESKEGLTTGIAPSAGFRRGAKIIAKAGKTLRDVRAARAAKAASQATNRAKNTTSAARATTTARTAANAKPLTPKEHATAIIKGMSSRRNSYPGINSKNLTPKGMQPKLNPIATTGNKATIDRAVAAGRSQARHAQQAIAMRARRTAFDKSVEGAASSVGKAMRRANQARKAGKVIKYGAIPAAALGVGSYFALKGSNNDSTIQPLSNTAKKNISNNNINTDKPVDNQTPETPNNNSGINAGSRRTSKRGGNKGATPTAFRNTRLMTEPLARINPSYFTKDKKSYDALRKELAADYAKNKVAEQITKLKDDASKSKASTRKQAQTKFSTNDWIGLGSNAIGSLASALINDRMLKNFKYPEAPVQMTAAKLKTNYNINPQLDAIREQNYNFDSSVDNNTGSSQVALARKQRNRLNRLAATNELYAQKENYQNEMINRDRLNQQGVTNQNIQAYNAWKQGKTAFENNIAEKRSENYIAGLQNLNSGVQDMLSRQEQRGHDTRTIKAMLAANPNVKPELFDYYGLNLYRFGGCKRNK
jgi:GH24 family phage-related lysozyme (muramidase)